MEAIILMSTDAQIESYLKIVSAQLGATNITEREKVTEEIAAHIRTSVEEKGESLDEVLARLGPAEGLGEHYREILATCQASRSYSPTVLLMAAFRRGILGIIAALIGLAGYWFGGILLVSGALTLGLEAMQASPHRPIPMQTFINVFEILVVGCLSLVFSTILLQWTLRLLHRRQSPI